MTQLAEALLPDLKYKREIRNLKKHLKELTTTVRRCIDALDAELQKPSSVERGSRIAAITNALELANDSARHFGLGEPLKKGKTQ